MLVGYYRCLPFQERLADLGAQETKLLRNYLANIVHGIAAKLFFVCDSYPNSMLPGYQSYSCSLPQ
jgi:hypothetical protein